MRQRVMIAMALACSPELIIADEPTTALDVTIQAQIVELITRLQANLGTAVIWISHDLGVVARLADQRRRHVCRPHRREGAGGRSLRAPGASLHLGLLNSLPRLDSKVKMQAEGDRRILPTSIGELRGCPFVPRCTYATEKCRGENPPLAEVAANHAVACWNHLLL